MFPFSAAMPSFLWSRWQWSVGRVKPYGESDWLCMASLRRLQTAKRHPCDWSIYRFAGRCKLTSPLDTFLFDASWRGFSILIHEVIKQVNSCYAKVYGVPTPQITEVSLIHRFEEERLTRNVHIDVTRKLIEDDRVFYTYFFSFHFHASRGDIWRCPRICWQSVGVWL